MTATNHATEPGDELRISAALALGLFFVLSLLYFFPALLPGRGIYGTDYLAGGYPFSEFIAGRLRAGELPKWVPYVFGGLPVFSNAGSTFYPVWLLAALVLPVAMVLPVLFVVQFALAGFGMFLLLREMGVRAWAALVAGLGYQFTGLTMSYVYAGHDGRVIVATLAPLFLYFLYRVVRTGRLAAFAGAVATLAFCLLSFQIQSSYYLLLAGLAWGIFGLVVERVRGRALVGRLALGLGAVAVAFALAGVNFLPFLDYVDASPRGGEEARGYEYATSWAMPPAEITGLAIPELQGVSVSDPNTGESLFPTYDGANAFKLHTEYVGALVLLLLALGAWYNRRDRHWWFFAALALFTLTIAFGGNTPIYRLYYELLPGTKRFRAPSISFFLVSMSLVAMAGLTLERLARDRYREAENGEGTLDPARWAGLGATALGLLLIILGGGAGTDVGLGVARFGLFLAVGGGLLWGWLTARLSPGALAVALALLTVVDLGIVDRRFFHTVSPPSVWFEQDDVVRSIRSEPERGRVWVLPAAFTGRGYQGSGNYLMLHDIDQAGGEHPNPLQRWYEYMGAGQGHYVDYHNFISGNPNFLNAANIRWIISMAQLEGVPQLPGLRRIHDGPSALVYENTAALPRAYLVGAARVADEADGALAHLADPAFDPAREAVVAEPLPVTLPADAPLDGEAEVEDYAPDEVRVAVRTSRTALLVLADNYYPDWEATLDGDPVPIHRTNHTLRGVVVPSGEHVVTFRFRPRAMYAGFAIYAAGLLALAGYGLFLLVGMWRRDRDA